MRSLLVHGVRSMLRTATTKDDAQNRWVIRLAERSHPNVARVELANKTARMAWATLRHGTARHRLSIGVGRPPK